MGKKNPNRNPAAGNKPQSHQADSAALSFTQSCSRGTCGGILCIPKSLERKKNPELSPGISRKMRRKLKITALSAGRARAGIFIPAGTNPNFSKGLGTGQDTPGSPKFGSWEGREGGKSCREGGKSCSCCSFEAQG